MKVDPIFKELCKPFEKSAYRDVTIGRTFTTIDAYHVVQRLTEVFGLCGDGWGFRVDEYKNCGDFIAAVGVLVYKGKDGQACEVHAVGDGRIIKGNVPEAMKKAATNMISKAASFIGVGLSVYMGQGIDDPYLDEESARKAAPAKKKAAQRDYKIDDSKADRQKFAKKCKDAGLRSVHVESALKDEGLLGADQSWKDIDASAITAVVFGQWDKFVETVKTIESLNPLPADSEGGASK